MPEGEAVSASSLRVVHIIMGSIMWASISVGYNRGEELERFSFKMDAGSAM